MKGLLSIQTLSSFRIQKVPHNPISGFRTRSNKTGSGRPPSSDWWRNTTYSWARVARQSRWRPLWAMFYGGSAAPGGRGRCGAAASLCFRAPGLGVRWVRGSCPKRSEQRKRTSGLRPCRRRRRGAKVNRTRGQMEASVSQQSSFFWPTKGWFNVPLTPVLLFVQSWLPAGTHLPEWAELRRPLFLNQNISKSHQFSVCDLPVTL
jgi:hypothetical protein